jgi:hypothetical protein
MSVQAPSSTAIPATPLAFRPIAQRVSRVVLLRSVRVPSHSAPGQTHSVRLFDSGLVTCSCAGYSFRGRCRHTSEAFSPAHAHCCQCGGSYVCETGEGSTLLGRIYCSTCRGKHLALAAH